MRPCFLNMLTITRGAEKGWTACLLSIWASGGILCVEFSPDGRHIAPGSADNTMRIWDAETGMRSQAPSFSPVISLNTFIINKI